MRSRCLHPLVTTISHSLLHPLRRLTFATLLAAVLVGCPYGPPIVEPPEPIDTPPFWFPEDVSPPNDRPVIVDLREEGPVVFEVRNVYDFNLGDPLRVRWTYAIRETDGSGFVPDGTNIWNTFFEGDVRPRAEQPFPDVTLYEGPSIRFERCFLPMAPGFARLAVRMEILDEIAPAQQETLGREVYIVHAIWDVQIRGDCDF